jgi:hypothetical protein
LVSVKSVISFNASITENISDFEGASRLVDILVKEYSKSYKDHNFSFRILLPRSKDSKTVNNLSKKLGLQIQNTFLHELKKLKLRPNIRELKYIHDENHFGWLLLDPDIYESL